MFHGFVALWQQMVTAGWLTRDLYDNTHTLQDVVLFCACHDKFRLSGQRRKPSTASLAAMTMILHQIVEWLAKQLELYVWRIYVPMHDVARSPPAKRAPKSNVRSYVSVTPEAVWDQLESGRTYGVSVGTVLAIKRDEVASVGCTSSTGRG